MRRIPQWQRAHPKLNYTFAAVLFGAIFFAVTLWLGSFGSWEATLVSTIVLAVFWGVVMYRWATGGSRAAPRSRHPD